MLNGLMRAIAESEADNRRIKADVLREFFPDIKWEIGEVITTDIENELMNRARKAGIIK